MLILRHCAATRVSRSFCTKWTYDTVIDLTPGVLFSFPTNQLGEVLDFNNFGGSVRDWKEEKEFDLVQTTYARFTGSEPAQYKDGLTVTLPDGTSAVCGPETTRKGQYLVQPVRCEIAEIYWGLLTPEKPDKQGILSPYFPPPDPPHVTLFYDRQDDEVYREGFGDVVCGDTWQVGSKFIYVGPEGVAADVQLTEEQDQWYMMAEESVPHVSLALHPKHQAKDLGPMVKRAVECTDWTLTQAPNVWYSPSCKKYRLEAPGTDWVYLERREITLDHGREKMDHPVATARLNELPDSLWSKGPTDVGLTDCPPVTFKIGPGEPIWLPQYPHKPEAEEGLDVTLNGLWPTGVLEESGSAWNTPILPVEKKETGKYRMAHDLRAINNILLTPTIPVPNPYVALTNLTPDQKWFICIDLANAFFCLPLAEELRDIFSFTHRGRQWRYTRLPQGFALSLGIFNQVLREALQGCCLPTGVTLVQYVDDLLLAAPTVAACIQATM
uniref:ribonuclease H n=1 Tax=Esox lucius TaxID=8010 RepID=A0A6Q2XPH9_ESOLU